MRKKINGQLMFILFVEVITTFILIIAVFYKIFQAQVWEDMKTYARILAMPGALESILADRYTLAVDDLRVTVVVLYWSLQAISVMLVALIAVCMGLSHYLTKSLISPIEKMATDMDHIDTVTIYEELAPFAETIREQHD